jgi:hypothetical protein
VIKSSDPRIVSVRDGAEVSVGPKESINLPLRFLPQIEPRNLTILLFVTDDEGNVEDTFALKTSYVNE